MTTRTEPRPAAAHVPPTPPPPAPAGMALTELLAALEGERRTHAAAVRAGSTRQEATMREPTMREPDAHAGASEPTAGVYGASIALSSVIGEATLRALKVVEDIVHAPDVGPAAVDGEPTVFGGLIAETDWPHRLLLTTNRGSLDISSALPFLPGLKPGDTVYLLDGFTESVEPIAVPNAPDQPTIWATMSGPGSATNAPGPAHSPSQKRTTR